MAELALAPEAETSIADALSELDMIIADPANYGQAIAQPLKAIRATVAAQHRMFVDGSLMFQAAMEAAKRPIADEDLAKMRVAAANGIYQGAQQFAYTMIEEAIEVAFKKWLWVASASAAGGAILILACGIGLGWLWWGPDSCGPQPKGGYACYRWVTLPS